MKLRIKLVILFSSVLFLGTAFLRTDQEKNIEAIRKRFWIIKTHQKSKFDILLYGDSRVYRGLSPASFQKDFKNAKILNFGYSSASYSSFMLDEIEKRLKNDSKLRILVLGITPNSLSVSAREDKHYRLEMSRKREEIIENLYLTSINEKFAPFQVKMPQTDQRTKTNYEYFEEYNDDGWVASWQIPADTNRAINNYINNFKSNQVSPSMIDSLMLRVKKWKGNKIKVFGFRLPTSEQMKHVELASGFNEKDFIMKFKNAGAVWFDVDNKQYQTYDGSHLEKSSAIKLSEFIAGKIKPFTR